MNNWSMSSEVANARSMSSEVVNAELVSSEAAVTRQTGKDSVEFAACHVYTV